MLVGILLCIVCVPFIQAQEEEIIVADKNKTECINDMIEWCNKMKYPQQSAGMSMLSVTYQNPDGSYRVFCSSDSDGTNCTKNQDPWFACSADHILSYKERPILSLADEGEIDDEICNTADKAFNELFVQNLSYDNTTLKKEVQKGFEDFFEQIAIIQQQIEVINRRLNRIPYVWGGLYDSIVLKNPEETLVILDEDNSEQGANGQEQSTELTSNESTPNESASEESASNESASNEPASKESTSNESTSNESASNESDSKESTSNESASDESTSNESASNESTSNESAPKESTSNESVSGESASSESAPSESTSNESASGESIPQEKNAEDTERVDVAKVD